MVDASEIAEHFTWITEWNNSNGKVTIQSDSHAKHLIMLDLTRPEDWKATEEVQLNHNKNQEDCQEFRHRK